MKLYENFEKAYKLILKSSEYKQLNLHEECNPEKLGKDKVVDEMIDFFKKSEDYEKCSILLKIKCWRHNQDKKYNL
jgi:uncharacterized protein YdiU (UPF0061 family)|tara:strand:+ start:93 stop:320 length:228 start_codon:yes stop_codon:yes gene_type:complete